MIHLMFQTIASLFCPEQSCPLVIGLTAAFYIASQALVNFLSESPTRGRCTFEAASTGVHHETGCWSLILVHFAVWIARQPCRLNTVDKSLRPMPRRLIRH